MGRVVREGFLEEVTSKLSQAGPAKTLVTEFLEKKNVDKVQGVEYVLPQVIHRHLMGWRVGKGEKPLAQHLPVTGIKQVLSARW